MAVMFARQPIFNKKNEIYGYELLYREGADNAYNGKNGDSATSSVMAAGFLSAGFNELAGKKKAFINFTKNMLINGVATLFPKESIVVEVLEDVDPTADIVSACKNLKKHGYIIALDDFIFRPGYEVLIDLADIIKVDFMLTKTEAERRGIIEQFRNGKIKFLAEKVETRNDYEMAVKAGYSLFQGYYFARPIIDSTKGIPSSKKNHIDLIRTLENNDPEFNDLTRIIEKDVAFSYEILRIVNTTHYYRGKKIVSVRQAALRMGLEELRKWALITVLRNMGGENMDAVVNLCTQRAKALELLSDKIGMGSRKMEFYTLGLLSMLDVMTGCSMEVVLSELSIADEIKDLLLDRPVPGKMGACYKLILLYEKGDWEELENISQEYSISIENVANANYDAMVWVSKIEA